MEVKSTVTNLIGAEIFLTSGEIELIVNTLSKAEEEAYDDYQRELTEFQKDREDYTLCEIAERHLQEIRILLVSFNDLLSSN